jgi:hypothetical protein
MKILNCEKKKRKKNLNILDQLINYSSFRRYEIRTIFQN